MTVEMPQNSRRRQWFGICTCRFKQFSGSPKFEADEYCCHLIVMMEKTVDCRQVEMGGFATLR